MADSPRPESKEVAYWRAEAHKYWDRYEKDDLIAVGFRQRREIMLRRLGDVSGKRVLDAGCGPGVFTRELLALGAEYHGIDAAKEMILMANAAFPDLADRFTLGSVTEMPYPDGFFNAALLAGVIEYIPDPADAIRELHRVLAPGGRLVVSFRRTWSPYNLVSWRLLVPVSRKVKTARAKLTGGTLPSDVKVHYFTVGQARRLFESCGFLWTEAEPFAYSPLVPPLSLAFPGAAARARERGEGFKTGVRRYLFNAFVAEARKEG